MKRNARAIWQGTGLEGIGTLSTPKSGAFKSLPYSFTTRFQNEDGDLGTNPEELIAAAHAGCFTMALSFQLSNNGFTPDQLETEAVVNMEKFDSGWEITGINLIVEGSVPGISEDRFKELAGNAKKGCPISKALSSVSISMEARLKA